MDPTLEEEGARRLADDLESGAWDRARAPAREATEYDGGLRLIVGPAG